MQLQGFFVSGCVLHRVSRYKFFLRTPYIIRVLCSIIFHKAKLNKSGTIFCSEIHNMSRAHSAKTYQISAKYIDDGWDHSSNLNWDACEQALVGLTQNALWSLT
jgi:hypothetical protein